jgi:hypothetical protein
VYHLQELRKGLDIVEDGGFEAAFSFLSAQLYEIADRADHSTHSSSRTPGAAAAATQNTGLDGEEEEEFLSADEDEDEERRQGATATAGATAAVGASGVGAPFGALLGAVGAVGVALNPGKVLTDAVKQVLTSVNSQARAEALGLPWGLSSWELIEELVGGSVLGRPELVLQSTGDIQHGELG